MSEFNFTPEKTEVQTLRSLEGLLNCVKVTIDGKFILSCTNVINIWDAKTHDFIKSIKAHNSHVESIDITPDGKVVVSCEGEAYDEEEREYHEIKLWDINSGELLKSIKVTGELKDIISPEVDPNQIRDLKFSPDGKYLAGATWNKIKIWDISTLKLKLEVMMNNSAKHISFSHDGNYFMTSTLFGDLNIWEFPSGKLYKRFKTHSVFGPAVFSQDDKLIISGGGFEDKVIKIWEFPSCSLKKIIKGHTGYISDLLISPNNKNIISASGDNTIKIWELNSGNLLNTLIDHRSPVFSLCFSADKKNLISGDMDGIIKIRPFEIPTEEKSDEIEKVNYKIPSDKNIPFPTPVNAYSVIKTPGHSDTVTSIKLTSDGQYLVSASYDNTVKIWDFYKGDLIRTLRGHSSWIISVCLTPKSNKIISSDLDGIIKIWDFKTGKEIYTIRTYEEDHKSITVTPDGNLLITGSTDGTITLWDLKTFKRLKEITVQNGSHSSHITSLLVTADNNLLITGSNDKQIKIWDLKQTKLIRTIVFDEYVDSLDISKDNNTIIASVWDGKIKLIDLNTGNIRKEINEKLKYVKIGRLSPEQDLLLSFAGSEGDGEFYIREVSSGEIKQNFYDEGEINDLIFSIDGKFVVSASEDPTIKVWSIETGKIVQAFEKAEGRLGAINISNDGKNILSSTGNKNVDVWGLLDGNLKNQLRGHNSYITEIKVSLDKVCTLSVDGAVRIWDLESGKCLKNYNNLNQTSKFPRAFFNKTTSLAFSEDSKLFTTGTEGGIINLWESDSGRLIKNFNFKKSDPKRIGDFKWVASIDIDPQGNYIAAGCQDGWVRVWEIETGNLIIEKPVLAPGMRVTHVQFTRDSSYIGASAIGSVIKLWNLKSSDQINFSGNHEDYITTFNFSQDNKFIISGSNDNKIFVRDLKQSITYGPFQLSSSVKFNTIIPENNYLLGADNNGEILMWDYEEKKQEVSASEAEEAEKHPFETYLKKLENIALLLNDVHEYLVGKEYRLSVENVPDMIEEIANNEGMYFMIQFMFFYYGVKKQLKNESQYADLIRGLKEIMGWEKQNSINKIKAFQLLAFGNDDLIKKNYESAITKFKHAHELDPKNPFIVLSLSRAYAEQKDYQNMGVYRKIGLKLMARMHEEEELEPSEEFNKIMHRFYEKRDSIYNFIDKRTFYKEFLPNKIDIRLYFCHILDEIASLLRGESNLIPKEQAHLVLEDLFEDIFEWLSIVCGAAYYHLEHKLGSEDEISDILDALKDINGFETHKNLDEEAFGVPRPLGFPDSISILSSPHQTVLDATKGKINSTFGNRRSIPIKRDNISDPIQSHILNELERLIKKPIPSVNQVDFGTHGVRIEDGEITELGLISCGVSEIPKDISKLISLKRLIVRDQNLSIVPKSIGQLKNLESLSICGFHSNKLESLPESIGSLSSLKELILENNRLNSLPESIGGLKNLEKLNLYGNNLNTLPNGIGKLKKLKSLYLALNRIKSLPKTLKNLLNLKEVSLHQNAMKEVPLALTELKKLEDLDLSMNYIDSLPDQFKNLESLKKLDYSSNWLTEFPEILTRLKNLEDLNLSVNDLNNIPESIGYLINLITLDLSYNRGLKTLPESMLNLRFFENLYLEECYNLEVPEKLKKRFGIEEFSDIAVDERGNINIQIMVRDWGCPRVIDYDDEEMRNLVINPDAKVIEDEKIKIRFTYPLSVKVLFEYENKGGFTRMELFKCIYEGYKKIYDEEESAAPDPGSISAKVLNRAKSMGKYGIWGHYLSGLYLERIIYNPRDRVVDMFIGS